MIRNLLYTLLLFTFLTSCKNQVENTTKTILYTQDSLFKIEFEKPNELDTLYKWVDASCTSCDTDFKYRFSQKKFPIHQESGWFGGPYSDTLYQITIRHNDKFKCKNERLLNSNEYVDNMKNKWKSEGAKLDTIFIKSQVLHGNNFQIVGYRLDENKKSGYLTNVFKAWTLIGGHRIVFTAECRSNECNGFIERMTKSFQTMHIEKLK